MGQFIITAPLWVQALLIVVLPTLLSMLGPVLVRRFVALENLATNNEVAGFKFATVGVLYAVLLAFSIVAVWEKFNDAQATVEREAGAAATIYHLAPGLGTSEGNAVHAAMTAYLRSAINDEWPAMADAHESKTTWQALQAIYAALLVPDTASQSDAALKSEIFYQLDLVTQARRTRLFAAEGEVPGPLWIVLFGGAVLTVIFTFFFGTKNLRAQIFMTGLLALLIFAELLIAVAFDRPFTGGISEGPDALAHVLQDFEP
jgi:hypothetical protein